MTEGDPEFLFDWEVLVNYEPKPWEEFRSEKSTIAYPFRVRVSEGDYYNGRFLDKKEYAGYRIEFLGREEEEVFGFARLGTEVARAIRDALASELDGKRALFLNLKFPPDAKFGNLVEIESVVSESW